MERTSQAVLLAQRLVQCPSVTPREGGALDLLEAELTASCIDKQKISDEVGDILFVAVNIARKAGVDPETALLACNQKFEQRFRYIEQIIEKNNKYIEDSSLEEMESLWQEAKTAAKPEMSGGKTG